MGYSERVCQLCGVSFCVGRIRKADEPRTAAWDGGRDSYVTLADSSEPCSSPGCKNVAPGRELAGDDNAATEELDEVLQEGFNDADPEHIAGPECTCTLGYSGFRISVDEMKPQLQMRCLSRKTSTWEPDNSDEDFEINSQHCFLTGISDRAPDEWDISGLTPVRHGVETTDIDNNSQDESFAGEESSMPMHPSCFEVFKRVSRIKLDKVDIDGLWMLREEIGDYENRFQDFPQRPDLALVSDQWYYCVVGTEYLVCDPIHVPGLQELLDSCVSPSGQQDVVFEAHPTSRGRDPFCLLSPEIRDLLTAYLSRADVANLRLSSASFTQLPQAYFRKLVENEMPWVWELDSMTGMPIDWHQLCCKLSAADGGSCRDESERTWRHGMPRKHYNKIREDLLKQGKREGSPGFSWTDLEPQIKREADAEIKAGYDAGMWPPRKTAALKGLRNRRCIWNDVEEIVRRIQRLPAGDDT